MKNKKNYISIIFILIIIIFLFFSHKFFNIKQVEISGIDIYSKEYIIKNINVINKNLMFINKYLLTKKIKKNFSHIKTVKIKKIYPNTIKLIFTPTKPIARVFDKNKKIVLIIDIDGKIMSNTPKISTKKLINIYGFNCVNNNYTMKIIIQILVFLHSNELIQHIEYIDICNFNDIKLGYQNRLEIKIGNLNKLNKKFLLLQNIIIRLSPTDNGILNIENEKKVYFIPNQ